MIHTHQFDPHHRQFQKHLALLNHHHIFKTPLLKSFFASLFILTKTNPHNVLLNFFYPQIFIIFQQNPTKASNFTKPFSLRPKALLLILFTAPLTKTKYYTIPSTLENSSLSKNGESPFIIPNHFIPNMFSSRTTIIIIMIISKHGLTFSSTKQLILVTYGF